MSDDERQADPTDRAEPTDQAEPTDRGGSTVMGGSADQEPEQPREVHAPDGRDAHEKGTAVLEEPDPRQVMDGHDVEAALLDDWRIMFDQLHARFETDDFATGLALVERIGKAAEDADHHPDVDLRYSFVEVHLSSHDVGGVTSRDVDLARVISDHAGRVGARAVTDRLQVLEIALDTRDADEVRPFWAALLAYDSPEDDDAVVDPDGRGPTLWFQVTDEPAAEADREAAATTPVQRFHLDLRLPPEDAQRRVQAALDAGGTLVDDAMAPRFTVLADAQGNKACVTTWIGRD